MTTQIKTLAYIPLHYGKEYLEATIKSIDAHVDKILILYTIRLVMVKVGGP